MTGTRRKFDQDFKEGAVRLVWETGRPIAQVARDLGTNESTLENWVNVGRRRRARLEILVNFMRVLAIAPPHRDAVSTLRRETYVRLRGRHSCNRLRRMRNASLKVFRGIRKLLRGMFPKFMHNRMLSSTLTKYWSEVEEDLLPIVVDRQRDAVDVGAYIGSYTVALAKLARTVYAFEPDAELANMLRRATPANVCVSHNAVADREGTSEFYVPLSKGRYEVTVASLVASPRRDSFDVRTVKTTTLDTALANSDVGFIKIDVEGGEEAVLAGGRQLIARCHPVVLVEANFPTEVAALSHFFESLGYAGFFVREGRTFGLAEFKAEMQDPQLHYEQVPRRQKRFLNNFFFAPSDAVMKLRGEMDRFLAREAGSPIGRKPDDVTTEAMP